MADKKISALTAATTPLAGTEVLPIVQSSTTKQVSVANLTAGRTVAVKNLTTSLADSNDIIKLERTGSSAGSGFIFANSGQMFGVHDGTRYPFLVAQGAGTGSLEVDSSSNVKFGNGNLVQGTAAKGINFTANSAAGGMTSQLLNWYETGTFTPVVADAATGGNVAAAATTSGIYTRVGNVVTVQFQASSINTTGMTAGNNLYIRGLPFANNSSQTANGVVDMRNTAFTVYPTVFLATSESAVRFFEHTSGAGVAPILVSAVTASSAFFVTLTYTV